MKKILGLGVVAILVMALVGGGTWAYFSDTEQSTGNTFSAGTLDLKVSNDAVTYADGVSSTWGGTNSKPGDSWSGTVTLKNNGSITPSHVEIKFSNAVTNYALAANVTADTGDPDVTDMSTNMTVTALSYNGTSILATIRTYFDNAGQGGNADGVLQLSELNNKKIDATSNGSALPAPSGGATAPFAMTVGIPTAVGNGIQGDQVVTTVTFGMFQHSSQSLP